jgi:hypothetical protein
MKQKYTIKYEADSDGLFAITTGDNGPICAYGDNKDQAKERLICKLQNITRPCPEPEEIEL